MKNTHVPKAHEVRRTETQIVIICPYCNAEHTHGLGGDDGAGHRSAHCDKDVWRAGYIVTPKNGGCNHG